MTLRLHNIFVQKLVHESLKVYDMFYKIFCVQCGLSKVSLLVSLVAGFLESTCSILSVVQTVNGTIGSGTGRTLQVEHQNLLPSQI